MIDTSSAAISFGIVAPLAAVLITAMLILLIGNVVRQKSAMMFLAVAGQIVGIFLAVQQWNNPQSGYFGLVMIDNFSVFSYIIFLTAGIIGTLMARDYLISRGIERFEFYAMVLFSVAGMMVMVSTSDLIAIFLGLEIMSIPLYVMAGFNRRDIGSNESSIKYFMMGAFASGFLLYGIALIYGAAETTDLRRIITDFNFIRMNSELLLLSGIFLVLFGFAFKIAAVPFHMWVPDVYEGAPTPVTAFFSVAPKAAGIAALLRIFIYGLPSISEMIPVFWVLAVLTMTVGNLLAIFQENIKRMLAYSSIAHAGYLLVALTSGGQAAVSSALFYLLAYTFFNLGGFTVVTMIDSRTGSKALINDMKGLSKAHPFLAVILALFMFALAGFPPTAGFFGKFYLFSSAIDNGFIWLVILAVMNSFVSVYYYLRVVVVSFFGEAEKDFHPVSFKPALILVLFITIAGTLLLGFFPQYCLDLARATVFPFI
ncbi:MAG: NADH-quinone oxidoreductase subunit N [Candidatus Zixiibacteriota bacterium]